ncbi:MAG: hypothetical protein IPJ71_04350 [Bdellovibrionales bacterium]|nr:hypothetical protein [Bdellovibrionales bacterium]
MNKQSKKNVGAVLAALGAIGFLHSNANAFEIKSVEMHAAAVRVLVDNGIIAPLAQENWYQINRKRLEEVMTQADAAAPSAVGLIEMLKAVAGPDVDIREVNLFLARLGTQDYPAMGK